MDYIPNDKSRQWTGEIDNKLFTFNGVSTCPSNYTEILEPPKTFKIYFNSTSMNNLNCPYSCRVGTVFDEKVLTVNESNFIYMPTASTTKLIESYNHDNGSYMLNINIEKVYPEPTCHITVGENRFNSTMITEQKQGFLYNVTYHYKLNEEAQYCGKYVSVRCIVSSMHNRLYTNAVGQLKPCKSGTNSHTTEVIVTVSVAITVILVILLFVSYMVLHSICKRKKLDENNTRYHAVSLNKDTKAVSLHIQQT
ncbi:Hypothetical predicted protein [Mytilus galloprovincialis]|uniref:Uncharacterized protein n=1 Tax=Mytilus galloprovincialis TaxID=29158 RepID=A0A8B6H659_MYTGA|nr:Hypothetical predicted protein [Mytilus galloprovincialis]